MQTYTTIMSVVKLIEARMTYREIERSMNIGSSTVQLITKRYRESGKSSEELEKLSASEVVDLFYPNQKKRDTSKPLPVFQKVYERMTSKKSSANLYLIWLDYKKEYPYGYQYTQFKKHYQDWLEKNHLSSNLTMAVERIPGEIMYIDWSGDTYPLVMDSQTGELFEAHFFVTTVGVSSAIFVRAFPDEKLPSFIQGTVDALEYYGAVPKLLKPDNLRTAVTKHTNDELLLNSIFRDLEHFYGVVVVPPPKLKPTGKATVENGVKWIEAHVIDSLKGEIFYDFKSLNKRILEIVDDLNIRVKKDEKMSRKKLFEEYDKPKMKLLGGDRFQVCDYKQQTVPSNYHVHYDNHYYSVPYSYFGQAVIVKATAFYITICDSANRKIYKHQRLYAPFPKYQTEKSHMPVSHQFYYEVNSQNGDFYRNWAKGFGQNTYTVIDRILNKYEFEEQAYRSCNGLLHICKELPKSLVESVCEQCIKTNTVTYSYVKKALNLAAKKGNQSHEKMPEHGNIRGKDRFK